MTTTETSFQFHRWRTLTELEPKILCSFPSLIFLRARGIRRIEVSRVLSLVFDIQNSISISSTSARTFVSTGWRIKIYVFVFTHSRTLTVRPHCALFRLSPPLIQFGSLSSQQILYAKYQLAVGPLPLGGLLYWLLYHYLYCFFPMHNKFLLLLLLLLLNLVWYKYRGVTSPARTCALRHEVLRTITSCGFVRL